MATFETTDAQRRMGAALELSAEKKLGVGVTVLIERNLMQLQITNICSISKGAIYPICITSQWSIYIHVHVMKQSKGLNGDLKPEHKKTAQAGPRLARQQTLTVRYNPSETEWGESCHKSKDRPIVK